MTQPDESALPESVAVSPSDKSSDRAQSDANNDLAVAANNVAVASQKASSQARETARLLAAFSHTTVVRLLMANFVLVAITTVIVLVLLLRGVH